jgi:hypothetical protein
MFVMQLEIVKKEQNIPNFTINLKMSMIKYKHIKKYFTPIYLNIK